MKLRLSVLGLLVSISSGCFAPIGAEGVTISPDSGEQCRVQCSTIGMELSAVAIMANHVGCVCQPVGARQASASVAAQSGMVTIMLQQQQEQQQQQQQQQQSYYRS